MQITLKIPISIATLIQTCIHAHAHEQLKQQKERSQTDKQWVRKLTMLRQSPRAAKKSQHAEKLSPRAVRKSCRKTTAAGEGETNRQMC